MRIFVRALASALLLTAAASAALAQEQPQPAPSPEPTVAATPQPAPSPQPAADGMSARAAGKAVVFIYRPGKMVGKALEPSVFVDGVEIGRMDNGRYIVVLLDPGEHRVHMTQDNKRVDLKLGAGEVAFVRIKIVMGMMKGRGEPVLADEEDAAEHLKKLEPLGADKYKANALAVTDKAEAEALRSKHVR